MHPLIVNICFSSVASYVLYSLIPRFKDLFLSAGLSGTDLNKVPKPKSKDDTHPAKPVLPEAQGVLCGAVYLIVVFLFIPVPFYKYLITEDSVFPYNEFVDYIAACLAICCMIFLGFADDVLNLKWRHKLWLPTMASLPLLMVYFINFHHTTIIVPKPFRDLLGFSLDLGVLYYIYMGMMAVFCTNAINILAGVNGLEAGQSLIIAISVVTFNCYQLLYGRNLQETHMFSLYLLLPYIGVCVPLLYYNWCPAQVFVGDTFCYFSGMTFAVVAILGHFSKTMLLFFVPQIINFIYSTPQLFKLLPCPRHRLPRVNSSTGLLEMSRTKVKLSDVRYTGRLLITALHSVGLLSVSYTDEKDDKYVEFNNMTIINLAIKFLGPIYERNLTTFLLFLQAFSSVCAMTIRVYGARFFYDD